MFTYLVALPVSVVFESPFLNLEKMVFWQESAASKFSWLRDTFKIKTGINSSKAYNDNNLSEIEERLSESMDDSTYEEERK